MLDDMNCICVLFMHLFRQIVLQLESIWYNNPEVYPEPCQT